MAFKDYTLREKELHVAMCRELPEDLRTPERISRWKSRLPKRLRGETVALVDKLRKLNKMCSHMELLSHYCPVEVTSTVLLNEHF
jgi:telomerase reverse transcriptase